MTKRIRGLLRGPLGITLRISAFALLAAGLVLGARSAAASSILLDHGNSTYDPGTHLEWLDLTQTLGRSYLDVIHGSGGFIGVGGWRYATSADLDQFFLDAGATAPYDGTINNLNHDPAVALLDLMGTLFSNPGIFSGSFGLLADQPAAGQQALGQISYDSGYGHFSDGANASTADYALDGRVGSFLVKTTPVAATPIPAALPLFAAALGGLGLVGWRRNQATPRA
jgi:hypothetical protein